MQLRTLPDLFQRAVHEHGPRTAVRYRRDGDWHPITYGQLGRLVEEASLGLLQAGVEAGDLVALVAPNGPQATIAELASLHVGATVLALDPGSPHVPSFDGERLSAAFVDRRTVRKELSLAGDAETVVELVASPGARPPPSESSAGDRSTIDQLYRQGQQATAQGSQLEERVRAIEADDAAHLVPTGSGPRILTHDAVLTEARAMASLTELAPGERCLSLLPIDEPLQRSAGRWACMARGAEAWPSRTPGRIVADLQTCRPELLVAPGSAYAAIRESLEERLAASQPSQRRLFDWARSIGDERARASQGDRSPGLGLRLRHLVAERLVLGKARAAIGLGQIRAALTPAGTEGDLAAWLRSIGLPLAETYSPPGAGGLVAAQRPGEAATGTLGRPLPGADVRVSADAGEGEVLVRGPAVGRPLGDEQGERADEEGWLATGERGRLSEGRLHQATGQRDESA